jgi:DNA modification methylase
MVELVHGDAVEVLSGLADGSVDLVLTDPPYNVSARGVGGRANTTVGRVPRADGSMREIRRDFGEWDHGWDPLPFLEQARRVLRDGGSLVAFTSEHLFAPYLASGLDHRSLLYWRKANPAPNFRSQVVRAVEMAVWQTQGGGWTFNAGGYRPNVWDGATESGEARIHPTQKPLWLMREWVELFSGPGELVVDPYAGSGTTLVAARALGRRALGVELDPTYYEAARRRLDPLAAAARDVEAGATAQGVLLDVGSDG